MVHNEPAAITASSVITVTHCSFPNIALLNPVNYYTIVLICTVENIIVLLFSKKCIAHLLLWNYVSFYR